MAFYFPLFSVFLLFFLTEDWYILVMESKDIVIIGGGVAGLSAGLYASRSGMDSVVIDAGGGGQVLEIYNLENYPGIFPAKNGTELVENLTKQAESFGAKIIYSEVQSIDKKGNLFSVKTTKEEFSAKAVIYATGAAHSRLGIPGEEKFAGAGVSYCAVCDGPFFKNKRVVVVGGGDSACSEALYLSNIASHVDLIHRRNELRAAKFVAEKIFENQKITVHFNSLPKEIVGGEKVSGISIENIETKQNSLLETDAVFIFVGMEPRTSLLETLKKDESGYIVTDEKMETSVPGLFVAGDVRSKPLRQIVTAASDGAIAAVCAAKYVKNL